MTAVLDHDLDSLAPPGNPDDFVVLEDRPVWKEHWTRETRDDDDNLLAEPTYMGRDELEKVAANCNQRITETGDFAPFVIGHTKEDGSETPEVIGFVGPYYVGEVGKAKPKAAIYAKKIWVFKEHYHRLKQLPRLSVEYWSDDDDPTNGFFDPISALGATTPELDLGIRYGRNDAGRRVMRYAKVERFSADAAPGGSNTFIPSCDDRKTKHKYEATMAGPTLTPEDLSMIVSALVPVMEAKIEEAVAAMMPQGEPVVDGDAVPQDPAAAAPGEVPPPGEPPEPGDAVPADGPPGDDDPPIDDDEPPSDEEPPMEDEAPAKVKAKAAKYQKERDDSVRKYQKEVAAHRDTQTKYAKLEAEVNGYRAATRRAERYAKLSALASDGLVFEVEEELTDTESLNDEQFGKHCDRIATKYSRVPINRTLPQEKTPHKDGVPSAQRVAKYAKQAAENVAKARKERKSLDYFAELKRLAEEDTAA